MGQGAPLLDQSVDLPSRELRPPLREREASRIQKTPDFLWAAVLQTHVNQFIARLAHQVLLPYRASGTAATLLPPIQQLPYPKVPQFLVELFRAYRRNLMSPLPLLR